MRRTSRIGVCVCVALAFSLSAVVPVSSAGAVGCSDANLCPAQSPLHIALMGDSYTAGNGAGQYVGPKGCYRSPLNWGSQVASHLTNVGFTVDETNVACSQATTDAVASPQPLSADRQSLSEAGWFDVASTIDQLEASLQAACIPSGSGESASLSPFSVHEARILGRVVYLKVDATCSRSMVAQVDQLPDNTNLVFMTLGGNDVGFARVIVDCFIAARVQHIVDAALGDTADLARLFGGPLAAVEVAALQRALRALVPNYNQRCETDIAKALQDVQPNGTVGIDLTSAVNAVQGRIEQSGEIVLVSYPYLDQFPDKLSDGYAVGEQLRALSDAGDRMEAQVAADANTLNPEGPHVTFVDSVKATFTGHLPTGSAATSNPDGYFWELPQVPGGTANTLKRAAKKFAENVAWGVIHGHTTGQLATDGLTALQDGFGPAIYSYYHPNPSGQTALAGAVGQATTTELITRFCRTGTPLVLVQDPSYPPIDPTFFSQLVADRTVIVTVYPDNGGTPSTFTTTTDAQGRLTAPGTFVGWADLWVNTGQIYGDGCTYNAKGSVELTGHGPEETVPVHFGCYAPPSEQ